VAETRPNSCLIFKNDDINGDGRDASPQLSPRI